MPGPTELLRMNDDWSSTFNGFHNCDLGYSSPALSTSDFCAKAEQLILVRYHYSAVDRGQSCNAINGSTDSFLPNQPVYLSRDPPAQVRELREGGRDSVRHGCRNGFQPSLSSSRNHQQQSTATVGAHGHGKLDQQVYRMDPGGG